MNAYEELGLWQTLSQNFALYHQSVVERCTYVHTWSLCPRQLVLLALPQWEASCYCCSHGVLLQVACVVFSL